MWGLAKRKTNMDNNSTTFASTTLAPAEVPSDSLYATYNGKGPSMALTSVAVMLNAVGLIGLLGNAFLCWVTVQNSSLRGTSNQLLAYTALFEMLHQTAHFTFLFVAATGTNFIPFQLSMYLQLHSMFGVCAAQMAMLLTALDRLASISAPMLHTRLSGRPCYLGVILFLCAFVGLFYVRLAIQATQTNWNLPVTGFIGDIARDENQQSLIFIVLTSLLSIAIYMMVWVVVRAKTASAAASNDRNSRLFRSLVVICCVVLGGYLFNIVAFLALDHLGGDGTQVWLVKAYLGVLLNMGASAEVPILYLFSTDYRKIFNHEAKRLLCSKETRGNSKMVALTTAPTRSVVAAEPTGPVGVGRRVPRGSGPVFGRNAAMLMTATIS